MSTYIIEVSFIDKKYGTKHRQSMECEYPDNDEAMIKACAVKALADIYFDLINEKVDKKRIRVLYCELVKL